MADQMTQKEASIGQMFKLGVRAMESIPTLGLTSNEAQSHIESDVLTEVVKIVLKSRPEAVDLDKLRELVGSFLPFGNEELADSEFGYPEGFPKKTWQDRAAIIKANFPTVSFDGLEGFIQEQRIEDIPEWVDDRVQPFIIPDPLAVADTYAKATVIAWSRLTESPTYKGHTYNYRKGALTDENIKLIDEPIYRQLEKEWGCTLRGVPTATAHERLRWQQHGVWPVWAQTGLRHRGRSVRRDHVVFEKNEWGLGPFEVACILLTDGEDRLTAYEHLAIDAPGALCRFEPDGPFGRFLCFRFSGGRLRFCGYWFGGPNREFGGASAFSG